MHTYYSSDGSYRFHFNSDLSGEILIDTAAEASDGVPLATLAEFLLYAISRDEDAESAVLDHLILPLAEEGERRRRRKPGAPP